MKTTSSVKKWGNSLAVRLPAAVADELGLQENSSIQITSDGKAVTIRSHKPSQLSLAKLVAEITPANLHKPADWGEPVGREVW